MPKPSNLYRDFVCIYLPVLNSAAYDSRYLYRVAEQYLSSPVLGLPVADRTPEREDIFVAEKAGHETVSVRGINLHIVVSIKFVFIETV